MTLLSDFEQFWQAYPRKVAKTVARRSWEPAMHKIALADLLRSVEQHKATKQWRDGFIPNPATFLSQERWNDELPAPPAASDHQSAAITQQLDTRRRRAEMQADGMSHEAIEAIFEAEYDARRP